MEISEVNPDGNVYQLKDATVRTKIAQMEAQNVYSTEETDTGKKWYNGKTIYRIVKTISVSSFSGNTWHTLLSDSFVTTIDDIISCVLVYNYSVANEKTVSPLDMTQAKGNTLRGFNGVGLGTITNGKMILEYTTL